MTTDVGRVGVADQALVQAPSPTVSAASGFDPSRGSLNYRISWPRPATPCDLVPLWVGEFISFDDWVNFAEKRLTGTTNQYGVEAKSICVDALGRRCIMGGDFMRARDEGAFPVRYFWECAPALVAATGTAETRETAAQCEAAQSGLKGNAQTPPGSDQ